ncbi:hypothetical protein ACWELB_20960 [Streptomyces asiaticus]
MTTRPAPTDNEPGPETPVQLTLPPELLAAMLLPAPIPSARRRGRRIRTLPDISNYQPTNSR